MMMDAIRRLGRVSWHSRHPSDACPEVIYAVCLQSMFGMVIQALMVGVVFAK